MKYFDPSYWFKIWLLSAPLFNDKTQVIKAMSVDNKQNIKGWVSESTSSLDYSQLNFTSNNQNHLDTQSLGSNLNHVVSSTSIHKHRHEKSRNRYKRQHTEKNELITETGMVNTVTTANDRIDDSGVVLNNKLYFGSWDGKVYEYDPTTEQQKVVITANDRIGFSGIVLNNKVYFSSGKKVYEYDPITGQQKIVITATEDITTDSGFVLNNKLYFFSFNLFSSKDGYEFNEYDPTTEQQKVVLTVKRLVTHISKFILNGKIYFTSIAPIPDCPTNESKKREAKHWDGKIHEYDFITKQHEVIFTSNSVDGIIVVFNSKLYFNSEYGKIYEYDTITKQQKVVFTTNDRIDDSGVVLNNKLYFWSYKDVYEYDPLTQQQKVVITKVPYITSGTVFNGKLYFGSTNGRVYEYDPLELSKSKIININEQVKRGLYLYCKENNQNLTIKNIKNINLDDLKATDIFLVENKAYSPLIENKPIENPCRSIRGYLVNKSEEKQKLSTAACDISFTTTHSIQKLNGFTATTSKASIFTWNWNLKVNIGAKATAKVGIPFIVGGEVETSLNIEPSGGETRSSTSTTTNANTETKTKIETKTETVKITYPSQTVNLLPHSKVQVSVLAEKRELEFNLIFNQKIEGEVSATITDENNISRNVTASIKKIMLKLQEHNILPLKISLNKEDESINFIYNTKIIEQEIISRVIVGKLVPLTNEELESRKKRDVFDISKIYEKKYNNKHTTGNELKNLTNWNDNFSKVINQEQHLISNSTNYAVNNVTSV